LGGRHHLRGAKNIGIFNTSNSGGGGGQKKTLLRKRRIRLAHERIKVWGERCTEKKPEPGLVPVSERSPVDMNLVLTPTGGAIGGGLTGVQRVDRERIFYMPNQPKPRIAIKGGDWGKQGEIGPRWVSRAYRL